MSRHWMQKDTAQSALPLAEAALLDMLPGVSAMAQNLRRTIAKIAPLPDAVLITGPAGSGRSHLAETLHRLSQRSGVLVRLAVWALDDRAAVEAALAEAAQSTLLIENIETLSPAAQDRLSALIDVAEVRGIRLVATARGTLGAVSAALQGDLFHRLATFALDLPPLTARREDLPAITAAMLAPMAGRPALDPSALGFLARRDWTGHLRELHNLLRRAAILSPGPLLTAQDLGGSAVPETVAEERKAPAPAPVAKPILTGKAVDLRLYLRDIEVGLINAALAQEDNHVARAADRLGLGRTTLIEKMRKNGIRYQIA